MPTDTTIIDRLRAEAEWFGSRKWGDTGLKQHGEAAAAVMRDAADTLTAAHAAGAPSALVALGERHDRALHYAIGFLAPHEDEPAAEDARAGLIDLLAVLKPVIFGSPAPAPVAPPAETQARATVDYRPCCGGDHRTCDCGSSAAPPDPETMTDDELIASVVASGRDPAVVAEEARALLLRVVEQHKAKHAAPPAVAGGDAPEIQVGDRLRYKGTLCQVVSPSAWSSVDIMADVDLIERNGVVIWRRRQEGQ